MPSITVGSIKCEAGQKAFGYITAVPRLDGSSFTIPVMIVAGKKDGPVLLVDAGVHGDEQEGPLAVVSFARELDPEQLRGVFIGVLPAEVLEGPGGRRLHRSGDPVLRNC